jgi:hypothetical protein
MGAQFNDAAIADVFDRIISLAMASGRFDQVNQHEPKSSPGRGVTCAVWVQRIRPIRSSGQNAISGVLVLSARIYTNFRSDPPDLIDPNATAAATDLMGSLSGDFELGGVDGVRALDLLGANGQAMEAQAGYIEIDRTYYRVMTITIPVIINDMWLVQSGAF